MVAENPACRLWRISRRKAVRHPHSVPAPCQYPSTSRDTASTGDAYDNELPYRRAYEEDEEDQRDTSDDDAYADTYGGSAPYGGQYDEDEDILHNDWHDYGEGYDDDYFDD